MAHNSKLLPPEIAKGPVIYSSPSNQGGSREAIRDAVALLEDIENVCHESSRQCDLFNPQYAMLPDCVHQRIVAMIRALKGN